MKYTKAVFQLPAQLIETRKRCGLLISQGEKRTARIEVTRDVAVEIWVAGTLVGVAKGCSIPVVNKQSKGWVEPGTPKNLEDVDPKTLKKYQITLPGTGPLIPHK